MPERVEDWTISVRTVIAVVLFWVGPLFSVGWWMSSLHERVGVLEKKQAAYDILTSHMTENVIKLQNAQSRTEVMFEHVMRALDKIEQQTDPRKGP